MIVVAPGKRARVDELNVIVPLHNGERFLPGALATMRHNHRDGIRFIVIDDHSDDESPRIVEAAQKSMPYITFLRNPENYGVARSRNIAFEHVDSRYLTYLDVDDWYRPGHLAALIDSIARLQTDMVRTDHVLSVGLSRTLVAAPERVRDRPIAARAGIGAPGANAIVDYPFLWAGIYDLQKIDRSLFTFDERLRTAADRPWFWRMHLRTTDYAVASGLAGYFYRKDPNPHALTQGGSEKTLHFADAYDLILDMVYESGDTGHIEKAAYGALRMTEFHLARRARLSPPLQTRLYARSAVLLSRLGDEEFETAARHLDDDISRTTLRRLRDHGLSERLRQGRDSA